MDIWVTMAEIEKGERGEVCKCPVALAMLREGFVGVQVLDDEIFFQQDGEEVSVRASATVMNFVASFDGGWPVVPFKFRLSHEFVIR